MILVLLTLVLCQSACAGDRETRLEAFKEPVTYTCTAAAHAVGLSTTRTSRYVLVTDGDVVSVKATTDGREKAGTLDVTYDGTMEASDDALINIANLGAITPAIRAKLYADGGPVVASGRVELAGVVKPVKVTYTRDGSATGLLHVNSVVRSADNRVRFQAKTVVGFDGLPLESETWGAFDRGYVTVKIRVKLARQ